MPTPPSALLLQQQQQQQQQQLQFQLQQQQQLQQQLINAANGFPQFAGGGGGVVGNPAAAPGSQQQFVSTRQQFNPQLQAFIAQSTGILAAQVTCLLLTIALAMDDSSLSLSGERWRTVPVAGRAERPGRERQLPALLPQARRWRVVAKHAHTALIRQGLRDQGV